MIKAAALSSLGPSPHMNAAMLDASLPRTMRWVMTTAIAVVMLGSVACGEQPIAVADGEGQDGSGDVHEHR